jgi:light-independent protochlorophyllide reductase subunit B
VHPLMMGLEEHLIGMFRHDFEFVDGHRSHLGDGPTRNGQAEAGPEWIRPTEEPGKEIAALPEPGQDPCWTADGDAELQKIPFFVRAKVRRNTERFARDRGIGAISAETLYDAKAHFSR